MKEYRNSIWLAGLLLVTGLWACKADKPVFGGDSYIYVKKGMPADSAMLHVIAPYTRKMGDMLNEVIAYAPQPLVKGQPNAPLGNYIADLLLNFARNRNDIPRADMALFNNGGLRTSIAADSVRVNDIYELMPFENALLLVKMPGDSLVHIAPYLLERGGEPVAGAELHAAGGEYTFTLGGNPVDPNRWYYVLTSDYLAAGGDRMHFFKGMEQLPLNIKMRDAIIEAMRSDLRSGKYAEAHTDDRIRIAPKP